MAALNQPFLLFSERILVSSDLWIITDGMRKNDNFQVLERLEKSTIQQLVGRFILFIINIATICPNMLIDTFFKSFKTNGHHNLQIYDILNYIKKLKE